MACSAGVPRSELITVVGLLSAVWVWRTMPDGVKPPALSLAAWRQTVRSSALMLCIAVTVLSAAAQFALFSYFAPYFKTQFAASPGEISVFFAWFGVFGFLGNALMSRHIERIGAPASVMTVTRLHGAEPGGLVVRHEPGAHSAGRAALGARAVRSELGAAGAAGRHRAGIGLRLDRVEYVGECMRVRRSARPAAAG